MNGINVFFNIRNYRDDPKFSDRQVLEEQSDQG